MKNTIKRILLLLPVISVLLVALAVPAFADYSPETGWSEVSIYDVSSISVRFVIDVEKDVTEEFVFGELTSLTDGYLIQFDWLTVNMNNSVERTFIFPEGYEFYLIFVSPMVSDAYAAFRCEGLFFDTSTMTTLVQYDSGPVRMDVAPIDQRNPFIFVRDYPPPVDDSGLWFFESVEFDAYQLGNPRAFDSDSVTSVWTEIMTWITSAFNSVMGAFYVDGSLTLLGSLAVIGVSVGIGFLLLGLIQRFLHLKG